MDPRSFRTIPDGFDQVLSLEQIRAIRTNNDYVDRPVAGLDAGPQTGFLYAHEDRLYPVHALPRSQSHQQHSHFSHLSRSSTVSSTLSRTSAASDQRLLAGLTPSHSGLSSVVRSQPKSDLKQDISFEKSLTADDIGQHMFICERCSRCKCQECCAPRSLPSCWVCNQRCECSPENLIEYGTCLCCVKGLFYHCSAEDDEENCADRPCACSSPRACTRYGAMTLLSLCLPCLCCYPPARLCLALCRCAHDRATRPGCRCTNTNTVCRKISASNPNAGPPVQPLRSKTVDKLL
ncbi:hypothetical protein WMY93_007443 [Mugilogobius chulae]|uniref:Sprouty RTK signaling antagonist 3 n=1 Tax=Mugilogobius chulae TaxID=88201 RepID=A0AAW0PGE2_9GOBI